MAALCNLINSSHTTWNILFVLSDATATFSLWGEHFPCGCCNHKQNWSLLHCHPLVAHEFYLCGMWKLLCKGQIIIFPECWPACSPSLSFILSLWDGHFFCWKVRYQHNVSIWLTHANSGELQNCQSGGYDHNAERLCRFHYYCCSFMFAFINVM